MLEGEINPDYDEEFGLPLQNRDKRDYIQNIGDFLGHFLIVLCSRFKVNGGTTVP